MENSQEKLNLTKSAQEPTTKYFSGSDAAGYWSALVAGIAVISGGASLAAHSFILTSGLLLGAIIVWWPGHWLLSKSCYFISATSAGFKDAFRTREVRFDEIRSVTRSTGDSPYLIFTCDSRSVSMPLDPIDEGWFSTLKENLLKRNITVSSIVFGIPYKEE